MLPVRQYTIGQRMGLGFAGVLVVAGVTFYIAKQGINARRKAELDAYRAKRTKSAEMPIAPAQRS
ncbi:hypothetical protein HYPSUDRAFT_201684 [Hypholoma sublateritium FD-334 SS-4]|uniref:Uncharacterized protein n=1 Tax=Hypholoma sublateritium (strain FD-334 SS-4) TaxID=945553 RepID=A0A0D2MHL2_HYPSF|nr:hypothetical protein HYPSUDRAFT_201684 [Hypholoma sublateritium FD-334 SS-4]